MTEIQLFKLLLELSMFMSQRPIHGGRDARCLFQANDVAAHRGQVRANVVQAVFGADAWDSRWLLLQRVVVVLRLPPGRVRRAKHCRGVHNTVHDCKKAFQMRARGGVPGGGHGECA